MRCRFSGRLRRVREALAEGGLDLAKVRVLDQLLGHLPEETVDVVLDRILSEASGLTTGQLRARVSRQVMIADPDGAASSFQEGLADRKVTTNPNPDFTGSFHILNGHPGSIAAARAHVEELARRLKSKDETRSLDQLRHDIALDLLQGRHFQPCNGGGRTNITVPATTLLELSDHPGDLDGYGPVIAEIARKTVGENIDGEWVFTVTDQGRPVATGTLGRRPTVSQQRQLRADYPTCVMVGCRQPVYQCDLDHRRPHSAGGPTHNDNLGPLCRHHHMVKHHSRWRVRRLPNGDHQWTSPLDHTYTRKRDPPE